MVRSARSRHPTRTYDVYKTVSSRSPSGERRTFTAVYRIPARSRTEAERIARNVHGKEVKKARKRGFKVQNMG